MKISVSSVVLNTFASRIVGTSSLYNKLAVQKGLSVVTETSANALDSVPFFVNIKEKVTKIATISKTDNEVVVEVNDEYIVGSINLAFNLYDRVAESATTMLKEIAAWGDNVSSFEKQWTEDKSDAWSKVCEEVAKGKSGGKVSDIIKQPDPKDDHFGTTEVYAKGIRIKAGKGSNKTIYVSEADKQIVVNALSALRDGEELPFELSTAVVASICQTKVDDCYYVGGAYDLPLSVINAVRSLYDLPLFPTEEQVEANYQKLQKERKDNFDKELADALAARKKAREELNQQAEQKQQDDQQPE